MKPIVLKDLKQGIHQHFGIENLFKETLST